MELTAKPMAVLARPGHFPYPGFRSAPVHCHRPRCYGRSRTVRWATGISGTGTEIKGVETRIKGLESQIRGVKRREKGETEKHKGTNFRNPLSHTASRARYIIWAKNKEWIIGRGPNYSFFIGRFYKLACDEFFLSCHRFLFYMKERSGLRDWMKNKKIWCERRKDIQAK